VAAVLVFMVEPAAGADAVAAFGVVPVALVPLVPGLFPRMELALGPALALAPRFASACDAGDVAFAVWDGIVPAHPPSKARAARSSVAIGAGTPRGDRLDMGRGIFFSFGLEVVCFAVIGDKYSQFELPVC
jgi:hypothetical protein